MSLLNKINKIKDFLLDLIFPKICLSCQQEGFYLCPQCLARIPFVDKFTCLGCGKVSLYGQTCETCENKIFLDGLIYAFNYSNPLINQGIKLLKYHGIKEMINCLAESLITMIKKSRFLINPVRNFDGALYPVRTLLYGNPSAERRGISNGVNNFSQPTEDFLIIPIPLHPKKFRWRGFNQSELLAEKLSQEFDLPFDNKILIKIKNTRSQTELKESQRQINIKNSFEVIDKKTIHPVRTLDKILYPIRTLLNNKQINSHKNISSNGVKDKIIFLIDDVSTTGSTLNEAAKILKKSGAAQVWGITIARG